MEAIWEDLRDNGERVSVPDWQKMLLDRRRKAVEEGRENGLDWDEVKHTLGGNTALP